MIAPFNYINTHTHTHTEILKNWNIDVGRKKNVGHLPIEILKIFLKDFNCLGHVGKCALTFYHTNMNSKYVKVRNSTAA